MKTVLCLVFIALVASAMAQPVDPIVSEAKLAIQSNSDLLTYGNGMYHPVQVQNAQVVREVILPVNEVIFEDGVRDILLEKGVRRVVVEVV